MKVSGFEEFKPNYRRFIAFCGRIFDGALSFICVDKNEIYRGVTGFS